MVLSQKVLDSLFGHKWASLLFTGFRMDSEFDSVIKAVTAEAARHIVYPPKPKIFEAFKQTDPDTLKVVFLVQDPYHDGRATGLAMANEDDGKLSPTLQVFKKEWEEDTGAVHEFDPTFQRYTRQGVMFLNTALTVREGEPKSHAHIWHEWTKTFITQYSKYNRDVLWILMGKHAQEYQQYITGGHVLKTVHPAAETYSGGKSGFYGCKLFYKTNLQLSKTNKPMIQW